MIKNLPKSKITLEKNDKNQIDKKVTKIAKISKA